MRTTKALARALLIIALATNTSAAGADPATRAASDVYTFEGLPGLVDVGDARLVRNDNGLGFTLRTSGLESGPHTVWWVVWNNPAACGADGCNAGDFGDPNVDVDIGYATGVVVGTNGQATLSAHLNEGPLTGFPNEIGITSGSGLIDARAAEIHLVVRSHGAKLPGLVGEQVTTFHAGCDYSVFGGVVPAGAYGTEGPNTCTDLQFAIFT